MYSLTISSLIVVIWAANILALTPDHHSIGVDVSGCQTCEVQYMDWLRNRTKETYWTHLESGSAVADHLCKWVSDIYYGCYSVCAVDTNNATFPFEDRKSATLKRFLDTNCLEGECRLADQMICRYTPPKPKCDPAVIECTNQHIEDVGCNMEKLCTETERRAFVIHMDNRMDCFVGSQVNKKEGQEYTIPEAQGLQQCKDIVMTHCLASWSVETYDWIKLANYSASNKEEFCSGETEALQCLQDTLTGTIDYMGSSYSEPCKLSLLRYPEEMDLTVRQVKTLYQRLCSDNIDPCAELTTTSTITETPTTTTAKPSDHDHHDHDHGVHITGAKAGDDAESKGDDNSGSITNHHVSLMVAAVISAAARL